MSTQVKKSKKQDKKSTKKNNKSSDKRSCFFDDESCSSSDSECEQSPCELKKELRDIDRRVRAIERIVIEINNTVNTILTTVNTILTTVNTILTVVNEILTTVNIINTTTMEILTTVTAILAFLENSCEAKETTIITIPTGGYAITTPGRYCLQSTQSWTPNANNIGAITITASDVDLNLNNYSITQANTTSSGNFGIIVTGGAKKVRIHDGTLENFSGGGILLTNPVGTVSCGGFINGPTVEKVTIERIQVAFSGYNGPFTLAGTNGAWAGGVLISGQPGNEIEDILVKDVVIRDNGLIGNIPQYAVGSITGNTLSVTPTAIFTGSISGTTLTVTAITSGRLFVGQQIYGLGISVIPATFITGYQTGNGGVGLYTLSTAQTVASTQITAGLYEPLNDGFLVSGTGVTPGTVITEMITPTTYLVNNSQTVSAGTVLTFTDPTAVFIVNGNVAGFLASYSKNLIFVEDAVQRSWGENQNFAYVLLDTTNVEILRSTAQDLRSFNLASGVYTNSSNDILIEEIDVSGVLMYVTPATIKTGNLGAEGVQFDSTTSVVLRKSTFTGLYVKTQVPETLSTTPISSLGALGATTNLGSNHINIEDSTFLNIFSDNGQIATNVGNSAGTLLLMGSNIHSARNNVTNVSASFGANAYGYAEQSFLGITGVQIAYSNNTFTKCTANYINLSEASVLLALPVAGGFRILGTKDEIVDCTVDFVQDLRTGVFIPSAYGIILDSFLLLVQANGGNILNNRITNCDTASLIDNTTLKNNIISRTYSYYNGAPGVSGYKNVALWIPIRPWIVASLPSPPVSGSQIDNLDIHN
jgi:hypothetical protein